MSSERDTDEQLIYVTGFGPFAGHEILNASWEAVRLLPETRTLVIHCGVHGSATKIRIETHAYNSDYCRADWRGKCLENSKIQLKNNGLNCDQLTTCIDVEKMVKDLNAALPGHPFVCSTEIGNYLCGYIYLNSLDVNCDRTLFIHVPSINKPYSSQQTSTSILAILDKCVEQLMDNGKI